MANHLPVEKKAVAIGALVEGNSIRSIERQTGIHRDTIMCLGRRAGGKCAELMDERMRDLNCQRIQLDEIWGFVAKKNANATQDERDSGLGDVWTFIALDADTKLVPAFMVGKRTSYYANCFLEDLAGRMRKRIQLSTDGLGAYIEAVERGFGGAVDYAVVVKAFDSPDVSYPAGKYSPPTVTGLHKTIVTGTPDRDHISTSFIESQNLTLRMHCRRLTRLTNAFSKKLENFKASVALHFAYYNFVKVHTTLRMTPAMAAGITDHLWTVRELMEACGEA